MNGGRLQGHVCSCGVFLIEDKLLRAGRNLAECFVSRVSCFWSFSRVQRIQHSLGACRLWSPADEYLRTHQVRVFSVGSYNKVSCVGVGVWAFILDFGGLGLDVSQKYEQPRGFRASESGVHPSTTAFLWTSSWRLKT